MSSSYRNVVKFLFKKMDITFRFQRAMMESRKPIIWIVKMTLAVNKKTSEKAFVELQKLKVKILSKQFELVKLYSYLTV